MEHKNENEAISQGLKDFWMENTSGTGYYLGPFAGWDEAEAHLENEGYTQNYEGYYYFKGAKHELTDKEPSGGWC